MKFDKTFVLTLPRRRDRLESFFDAIRGVDEWPFDYPEIRYGADGRELNIPHWCGENVWAGSWGNSMAFARIIEDALTHGWESVMIFEDDCCFRDLRFNGKDWEPTGFSKDVKLFWDHVPDDWDAVYFGGILRTPRQHPPMKVNDYVLRPWRSTATHAVAMNRKFMKAAYDRIFMMPLDICDKRISDLHCRNWPEPEFNAYLSFERLCGQAPGESDISVQVPMGCADHPKDESYWDNPTTIEYLPDFKHS